MKNHLQLLCALVAVILLVCAFWMSPRKRAQKPYEMGLQDLADGSNQAALDDFTRAIKADPKFVEAYLNRAAMELAFTNTADALADCSTAIRLAPSNELAFLLRGDCRLKLKEFPDAIPDLNMAIALNTNDMKAYFYRGAAQLGTRNWDGAVADFTRAIQLNPDVALAYCYRAGGEIELKDYEKAVADASTSIRMDNSNVFAYRFRADAKTRLKDRSGAMADADRAVELKPLDASSYLQRALTEISWDDFPAATADLDKAFQINPNAPNFYAARATLERKRGDTTAALADFDRALQIAPHSYESITVHESLAHLESDLFQWRPALEQFRLSLAGNPTRDYLRFYVFLIESRLGQTDEAQKELAAYVQSIPPTKPHEWTTSIAEFLTGQLMEGEFLAQATTTAKRATDISGQTCEANYFIGMKHLLAGDKTGAAKFFKKSVDTGEDNYFEYRSARAELNTLKNPWAPENHQICFSTDHQPPMRSGSTKNRGSDELTIFPFLC